MGRRLIESQSQTPQKGQCNAPTKINLGTSGGSEAVVPVLEGIWTPTDF